MGLVLSYAIEHRIGKNINFNSIHDRAILATTYIFLKKITTYTNMLYHHLRDTSYLGICNQKNNFCHPHFGRLESTFQIISKESDR
jgi:hypothetical protein